MNSHHPPLLQHFQALDPTAALAAELASRQGVGASDSEPGVAIGERFGAILAVGSDLERYPDMFLARFGATRSGVTYW